MHVPQCILQMGSNLQLIIDKYQREWLKGMQSQIDKYQREWLKGMQSQECD